VSAFRAFHHFDIVVRRLVVFLEGNILPQHDVGEFHGVDADKLKVRAQCLQVGQFQAQQFLVPTAVQGELVVDDVGALLDLGEVAEFDAGNPS
jgi:hypothetical protein